MSTVTGELDLYFLQGLQKEFLAGGAFSDFAIFGGSLVDVLMDEEPNDLDIAVFVKGKNNKEKGEIFAKKVQLFVEKCILWMENQNAKILRKIDQGHSNYNSRMLYEINDNEKLKINRFRNVFTVQLPCCQSKIQFIPKDGIDDLLNDIDISCTAIMYFQHEVIMSEKAKKSIESLAFEIDENNGSEHYLQRVVKYFGKNFDIILPNLDISKIPKRLLKFQSLPHGVNFAEVLDLKYLNVPYIKVKGNKIETGAYKPFPSDYCKKVSSEKMNINKEENIVGLTPGYGSDDNDEIDVKDLIYQNIRNLANKRFDRFNYIGQGELWNNAFKSEVFITERMLINSYETAKRKMWDEESGNLNLGVIEQYLPYKPITDIVNVLLIKYAATRKTQQNIYSDSAYKEYVSKNLDKMIAEQTKECKKLLLKLKGKGNLSLQELEKNNLEISKQEFYGKYLKKDKNNDKKAVVVKDETENWDEEVVIVEQVKKPRKKKGRKPKNNSEKPVIVKDEEAVIVEPVKKPGKRRGATRIKPENKSEKPVIVERREKAKRPDIEQLDD